MLLDDGTILTGTSPEAINPSVQVCHEIEPYCAAFGWGLILASVCLHRAGRAHRGPEPERGLSGASRRPRTRRAGGRR